MKTSHNIDLAQALTKFSRMSVKKKTMRTTLGSSSNVRSSSRRHNKTEESYPMDNNLTLPVYEKFSVTGSLKSKNSTYMKEETRLQSPTNRQYPFVAKVVEINSPDQIEAHSSARQWDSQLSLTKIPEPSNIRNLKKLFSIKTSKDDHIKDLELELREMKLKYARMVAIASEASGKHPDTLNREEPMEDDSRFQRMVESVKLSRMAGKFKNLLDEQQKIAKSNQHLSKGRD